MDPLITEKKGIAIMGNIIIDTVKTIDCYPDVGMMAYVEGAKQAIGGCVPNTATDLAKIDCTLPVSAIGCVGSDENGRFAIDELTKNGVNVDGIICCKNVHTSFCDVMSMPGGERTFFHCKGANAVFAPEDVDIGAINADILHAGYILLMDKFDCYDNEYGTVMARFLSNVQKAGIKTSVDVVSDNIADYGKKIIPALKYCNYFIVNEIECCRTWNLDPKNSDGSLNEDNVKRAMINCAHSGVKDKVVVHSKEISFILDVKSGNITRCASLKIPAEKIKGSVGAGDAFCAGSLYGIYSGYTDEQILEFASGAAACSLFEENSTDGIKDKTEIFEICSKYKP